MPVDEFTVFYAWQSDSPSRDNRNFIETALEGALKAIQKNGSIASSPRLDKDTKGVPGIPDIANTILEKIRLSDAFVADVSFVGTTGQNGEIGYKIIPNPNVMIELGYALAELGWERIMLVLNTATGVPDKLPFDLRHRRWPYTYEIKPDADDPTRVEAKKTLTKNLHDAVKEIAKLPPRQKQGPTELRLDALETMVSALSGSIAQYTNFPNSIGGLQKSASDSAVEVADPRTKCQNQLNDLIRKVSDGNFYNVLFQQGMFVLSILPASAPLPLPLFDGQNEHALTLGMPPLAASTWDCRRYGDRFVTTSGRSGGVVDAATEITVHGTINAASHEAIAIRAQFWPIPNQEAPADAVVIPSVAFEKSIIESVLSYLKSLKALDTKGPWYVGFGIINVKKSLLYVGPRFEFSGRPFEGDEMRPPIVEIPMNLELENQQTVARALRPAFDYIWREHNYPKSLNYAETGDWVGH